MKIAACFITKGDEELESLKKAVASVYQYVDSVYITANGEKTLELEKFCKDNKLNYSYLAWNDNFSDMRNFNFSQVKEVVDYIFWMDSDDILVGAENLKQVAEISKANGKDVVFFTYWYGCSFNGDPSINTLSEVQMEQMRERLLKPGVTTWKKRLHETPIPVSGAKNNYTTYPYDSKERPMAVMHTSKDTDLVGKMERNKRILEAELKEERMLPGGADPRTLLYLMKIYAEAGNESEQKECIKMGVEYLEKSGWNEERATCLEQMGICRGKLGDFKGAVESFQQAVGEWPLQPLIVIRLALAYYNLKNYRFSKHWLDIAMQMDIDNKGSNLTNIKAMKLLTAELLLKLHYNAQRDTKKAVEAAKLLYQEDPNEKNAQTLKFLEDLNELNSTCERIDNVVQYLDSINAVGNIIPLLNALPDAITVQPFAQKIRQQFSQPRRWNDNEICYFANFGTKHFEQWDMSSLDTGVGGSETAVLQLAKQWTKLGYKVTIYGDPKVKGEQDGVTILPWYYFNHRDSFNILVQWRSPALAGKIKARKFLVDLHDIYAEVDFDKDKLRNIDKIMVKSNYQRSLAPNVEDSKFEIVGNGVSI